MIEKFRALPPSAQGAILMSIALLLFSCMDIISKTLTQHYNPLQVVWARYTSQTVLAFLILAPYLSTLLRTKYFKMQLVRSAFLFGGTLCFFISLKFMPIVTVTAIFEVSPLFITLAAFFVLREQVGPRRWIGVGLGMIGALIIIRPGSAIFTPIAFLPMAAAACYASYTISTRFLGQDESPWTSFLYTALIGTIASCLFVPLIWETPTLPHAGLMSIMGVFGGIGHYLLIRALTMAEASFLAPFGYLALLYNALWGLFLFAEIPDTFTIMGATTIVGAGLFVWYRETMTARKARTTTSKQ